MQSLSPVVCGGCFQMAYQHDHLHHHYYYDTKDWLETSQGAGSQGGLTSLSQSRLAVCP